MSHAGGEPLHERQTFPDGRLTDDNSLANTVRRVTGAGDVVRVNKTLGVSEEMSLLKTAGQRRKLCAADVVAVLLAGGSVPQAGAFGQVLESTAPRRLRRRKPRI